MWAIFTFIWKVRDFFFPCAPLFRNTRCAIDSLSAIFCYICLLNVKSNEPKSKKGNKCYLVYWYGTIPTQTKHTFCVIRHKPIHDCILRNQTKLCVWRTLSQPYLTQYDLTTTHLTCVFLWLYTNRTARENRSIQFNTMQKTRIKNRHTQRKK